MAGFGTSYSLSAIENGIILGIHRARSSEFGHVPPYFLHNKMSHFCFKTHSYFFTDRDGQSSGTSEERILF